MSEPDFTLDDERGRALSEYAARHTELLGLADIDAAGLIRHANPALERLVGHPLAGTPAAHLVTAAQRPTLEQALAESGPEWTQRLLGLSPDPRGVPVDFVVSVRRAEDGYLLVAEPAQAAVSAVNDWLLALNDELTRAQRQINQQNTELARQNERLLELDQLKDVLLANVSHDLRTPLTAILGYAELMRRRGGLPLNHAHATEVIERNARRLLQLVNDLLLLAQARAGALRLELEDVDLVGLAKDARELVAPLAAQRRLGLALCAPAAGGAVVRGDRLRLGQLLDNLVSNAVKFSPEGGRVAIVVVVEGERAALSVTDTGPGIPESERARLFDPFSRGERSAGVAGTGLGLAIVRAVADAHGATVEVDAPASGGTRFTVSLPQAT